MTNKPRFTATILNGPNLNLLGEREPDIYGHETLGDIEASLQTVCDQNQMDLVFKQSNHEGALIEWIHEARLLQGGLIINPAAYGHTSIALYDALKTYEQPIIECHLSNPLRRESFRHHSYVSSIATGIISGFGAKGYHLALQALISLLKARA